MTKLIDRILENIPYDTISDTELFALLEGSIDRKYSLLKRTLQKGELIHLRRGLYQLAKRYQRRSINPYTTAQRMYGPSYISFESALSYYGLIPEAVYTTTSASLNRSREFKTPLGIYSYVQIPQRVFYIGVERIERDTEVFLLATSTKALADYVFFHRPIWTSTRALIESLRIDWNDLEIKSDELNELIKNYKVKRVTHFLERLKLDLSL